MNLEKMRKEASKSYNHEEENIMKAVGLSKDMDQSKYAQAKISLPMIISGCISKTAEETEKMIYEAIEKEDRCWIAEIALCAARFLVRSHADALKTTVSTASKDTLEKILKDVSKYLENQ